MLADAEPDSHDTFACIASASFLSESTRLV